MAETAGIRVEELGLFTDLYQLTMAQSYLEHQKNRPATFSLIIRKYPPHYSYMVATGLATVLEYLEQVRFFPEALAYLQSTGRFSNAFLDYLARWHYAQYRGRRTIVAVCDAGWTGGAARPDVGRGTAAARGRHGTPG